MFGTDLSALGPLPGLQIFGGLLILVGLAVAIWKGIKDSRKPSAGNGGVQMFFDGPIAGALRELNRIADSLETTPNIRQTISDLKALMFSELEKAEQRHGIDLDKLETRVRDCELTIAHMGGRGNRR